MIDPDDPLELQVAKQAKIIQALVSRAGRQNEIGDSGYAAFQSAIALQGEIWAKTRDLERASNELQSLREERKRTQKNLTDALSVMEGGFALFADGRLQLFNELFQTLLPDLSDRIRPGLDVTGYFALLTGSRHLVSGQATLRAAGELARAPLAGSGRLPTPVIELDGDRWFQLSLQSSSSDSLIILLTEITGIVRQNRSEKDTLIDRQADYMQAAFNNMSVGIATFSARGTLRVHNDRFRDLLQIPRHLLQAGTRFAQIVDCVRDTCLADPDQMGGIQRWREVLQNDEAVRERLTHVSGAILDIHLDRMPDRGFLVNITDATLEARTTQLLEQRVRERTSELTEANRRLTEQSRKQARVEEELRLAKETAEAAVSSKTRFLAAASHDLLQPVNAAKLLISTLSDQSRGSAVAGLVERLEGSFNSIETLLHALLDISRLESTGTDLSPSEFCLGPLMRTVIEDQLPMAQKKGVRLDVVPSSLWVRSDQRYLMRSVQNLVVNAIQYTENGRVLVGCRRCGDAVRLEVWDTGIGISLKDQKRVFDEFTRADNVPPGSGMGLGLSIVDRTCRHLGHTVRVRSKPGVGSIFSIEMAVVVAARQDPPRPEATQPATEDGCDGRLVLVIENDPDVLFATVQKLESWGASVFGTRATDEALQIVRDIGIAPDIILADYQLDGTDTGVKAICGVRQTAGVEVPAVLITANRNPELATMAQHHGFSVMTKPVDLTRLRRQIAGVPGQSGTDKSIE
ncbi:hybrid sensor histidine kinase/response regulator [Actibacterium ureilyticum]|uniref:hybrid sensor histidine kinase/response regulator n=1 Tax=Actibacterium ureilyticum TaxID=1590614 RepID=UPI000BAAE3E6|nr:ATP-binding protein [Actibacterium ureilyticum]